MSPSSFFCLVAEKIKYSTYKYNMFASVNLFTNSENIFSVNFFRLRTYKQCEKAAYTLLKRTNTRNLKQIFSEKELRGHSPNFNIHVSVNDLYIPTIRSAYSVAGNMWTDPGNI